MSLFSSIKDKKDRIAVVGLGYVGMPIAVEFAKKGVSVIGYDYNSQKIEKYKQGIDPTNEVGDETIKNTTVEFTSNPEQLIEARFFIIAVPTPINQDKTPNLYPVESASEIVGKHLQKGSIVVYESTVYPGVTEDICIPILEKTSGLKCGEDFKVGYSPERINPGDKVHRLENIVKVVSGIDKESLEEISKIYSIVIEAGVHKAGSIKVAEACKVVENSQRDINIAFMNELAKAFDLMDIDTREVIDAMNTKWNALRFFPGLVGGHCIGVDPYYFVYEAEKLGYHSQIIAAGRRINDDLGEYVAQSIIKKMIQSNLLVKESKVVFLGLTFKENTPDTRNTKVVDVIKSLENYGVKSIVVDPVADKEEAKIHYGIKIQELSTINNVDVVVFAVPHSKFDSLDLNEINKLYKNVENEKKVFIDIKSKFSLSEIETTGYNYWRL